MVDFCEFTVYTTFCKRQSGNMVSLLKHMILRITSLVSENRTGRLTSLNVVII